MKAQLVFTFLLVGLVTVTTEKLGQCPDVTSDVAVTGSEQACEVDEDCGDSDKCCHQMCTVLVPVVAESGNTADTDTAGNADRPLTREEKKAQRKARKEAREQMKAAKIARQEEKKARKLEKQRRREERKNSKSKHKLTPEEKRQRKAERKARKAARLAKKQSNGA